MREAYFVGLNLPYPDALKIYKEKVSYEFDELTFFYCVFTGMAEADCID